MSAWRGLALAIALSGAASAQTAPAPANAAALEGALQNFPAMVVGSNTRATTTPGEANPRACPAAGARVEQKGGPTFDYEGASPGNPTLCRMRVGGEAVEAWYGIWVTSWPGADAARRALDRIMQARTGDTVGFDTIAAPGVQWHDLVRQEGIEDITILDVTYRALRLAHYREGYDGNTYRSVSTVWKDMASGLLIYGTYQHIAGRPELDDPLIPTRIVPAP